MTCQIQNKIPVQLYVSLPSNGCTSDLKIYYHPDGGEQRSVFSCDWDVKTKTYDCGSSYPGVAWHRADANHVEIKLPETSNMNDEHFRYQFSCHDHLQSGPCLTPPAFPVTTRLVDSTTTSNITEATSKIFNSTTMNNSKEKSEHSYEAIMATAVAFGIGILILVLILTFLLRKNRRLKRSIKKEKQETASKKAAVNTTSIPLETIGVGPTDIDLEVFADSGFASLAMSTDSTTPIMSKYKSDSDLTI
ncbi:uncharacterized protein LOC112568057 isoform X2 [Pomacea canaliculata]|uniref:uncharacterized protein LOC112568057 isoform X2 n=1 Tax=Pomacea canaliculata TaxID=400727 RepID=UPI000D732879|nr:uncharacterized protein LOC112568057 isoform X2 [Pomacea canaliculata]